MSSQRPPSERPPKLYGENHPEKKRLRAARERTITLLTDGFAEDVISLEGYETLVADAYACKRVEDLEAMLVEAGLAAPGAHPLAVIEPQPTNKPISVRPPSRADLMVVPPPHGKTFARAILGSTERKGRFSMPDRSRVEAYFGSVEIDLRDVDLPPGVTEIHVKAFCGSIEIVVPAHIAVDCAGNAILGSFEGTSRVPAVLDPLTPCLRVVGSAVCSSIEIRTRPPEHVIRAVERKRLGAGG